MLFEAAVYLLVGGNRVEPILDESGQFLDVIHARGIIREASVARQFRTVHRIAQVSELMIDSGHDKNRMPLAFEDSQRRHREMMRAVAMRWRAGQARQVYRNVVVAEIAIEQRSLEVLTFTGSLAMK